MMFGSGQVDEIVQLDRKKRLRICQKVLCQESEF